MALYDSITYLSQQYALQNGFRTSTPDMASPPGFAGIRDRLPQPAWPGHEIEIAAYWNVWEQTFDHLKANNDVIDFAGPYLDTFFNGNLFLWDSVFALQFARYGRHAFDFSRTIDTFYRKQHIDGFICRELSQNDGSDTFTRFDPCSTGPNVFAWFEQRWYRMTGDANRVADVFDALMAYHIWLRLYRSWPDGSYWYTGWGGGLDNQLRHRFDWARLAGDDSEIRRIWFHHGFASWIEATALQYLSARTLVDFAHVLGRDSEVNDLRTEMTTLSDILLTRMWNDEIGYFTDVLSNGELSRLKSVASYWILFTGLVDDERSARFVAHLEDPHGFATPHMVPAVSVDTPEFDPEGDYWNGGVWPPTSYMVVEALREAGFDALAAKVGRNHHRNTVECFAATGTIWENYSPSGPYPGKQSKPGYSWSGLGPVALLIEQTFGIQSDGLDRTVTWTLDRDEPFSLRQYPFGATGTIDFEFLRIGQHSTIRVDSSDPFTLTVRRHGITHTFAVNGELTAQLS